MVIEIAIVGALALHVLLNVLKVPFPGLKFPVKELQLAAGTFNPVPAPVHLDFPRKADGEPGLAEPKRLCQWDHLALALIHPDTNSLKPPHQFTGQLLQLLNIGEDDIVVIHVMAGTMYPSLALDEVIHGAGQGHHLLLRRLYAQRQAPSWRGTGGILDNGIRYLPQIGIEN